MTNPFVDQELINAAKLYDRILVPIQGLPQGFQGEASAGSATLATAATDIAASTSFTIPLATSRRIRFITTGVYRLGTTTTGRASLQAGYNTGGTVNLGSVVKPGSAQIVYNASGVAGIQGGTGVFQEATQVLPAGTYTIYAVATRLNNGSSTDTMAGCYIAAYDMGGA